MSFVNLKNKGAKEIVFEALDMNDLERQIYDETQNAEKTVKDLVKVTGRTRSVVQRALQRLLEKNVLLREGKVDRTVYYVYTAVPFDKVKQQVGRIIDQWHRDVKAVLGTVNS